MNRNNIATLFLPENMDKRALLSYEEQYEYTKALLCSDELQKRTDVVWPKTSEVPHPNLPFKESSYFDIYYRYDKMFDFGRTLGVGYIYDIGCGTINQAFPLISENDLHYTGMDTIFELLDWREEDKITNYYTHYYTRSAPLPFSENRISFMRGIYPENRFDVKPEHLAIASCSLTMCNTKKEINNVIESLQRDFDRILFNPPLRDGDYEVWVNADWSEYEVCPIDYGGSVYATKYPEDINNLQKVYPMDEDGILNTQIRNFVKGALKVIKENFYTDWTKHKEKK